MFNELFIYGLIIFRNIMTFFYHLSQIKALILSKKFGKFFVRFMLLKSKNGWIKWNCQLRNRKIFLHLY